MQHQQETVVHIIYILNVTRYATQVNRQHINLVMEAVERTHQDVTMLYNITGSLYTSLKLPADCTLHLLHFSKSWRFTLLYETSGHACTGLHRHSYSWYTITSHTSSRRSPRNVNIHWRDITFNHALTSFIRIHTPLLQTPMHPCFDHRLTVSTTNWCTHTGSHTITWDTSSLQFNHTKWKLISTLWHRYQVFRHILWWNKSHSNFRTAVHYMSTSKWTVLQH